MLKASLFIMALVFACTAQARMTLSQSLLQKHSLDVVLRYEQKQILDYLLKYKKLLLSEDGIKITSMVDDLKIHRETLEGGIRELQEKLPGDHFIQHIETKIGLIGKRNSTKHTRRLRQIQKMTWDDNDNIVYHVISPRQEALIAYFEGSKELLEGSGIAITEVIAELQRSHDFDVSSGSLGQAIGKLKRKLPEDHFIQEIESERRRVEGKYVVFYRFKDPAATTSSIEQRKQIIDYFEKRWATLLGDGIIVKIMAEELGISSASLRNTKRSLGLTLPVDHPVRQITSEERAVSGSRVVTFYIVR